MKLHSSLQGIVTLLIIVFIAHSDAFSQYDNNYLTFSGSLNSLKDGVVDIVLDPGHGGKDRGCNGSYCLEKDLVLEMCLKIGQQISSIDPAIRIHYTRTTDNYVSLKDRIKFTNAISPDLFISVHYNADVHRSVTGSETYVGGMDFINASDSKHQHHNSSLTEKDIESLAKFDLPKSDKMVLLKKSLDLAAIMEEELKTQLPFKSRGVKEAGFAVLKYINSPAVLIEGGFLTNKNQENYINSAIGKDEICSSIVNGILNYLGKEKTVRQIVTPSYTKPKVYYKPTVSQKIVNEPKRSTPPKSFSIVIASSLKKPIIDMDEKWEAVKEVRVVKNQDTFVYELGNYGSIDDALHQLNGLKELGFKSAYISENSNSDRPTRKPIKYTVGS